jgi:predicted metal-dependent HD superfamily phosphohydrolase
VTVNADERVVRTAWRDLGGDEAAVEDVLERHCEPHRRYHTVSHVAWVLRVADELLASEAVEHPDAVRVAAIFHDAVYDARAADNELRSADLAAQAAEELGWPAADAAVVHRLVLATAAHEPADADEAVLLDADLSILGAHAAAYDEYVRGVRAEYGHVDDDGWRSGRGHVLRRFLDRPHIYATATMRGRAEESARVNLSRELASLGL